MLAEKTDTVSKRETFLEDKVTLGCPQGEQLSRLLLNLVGNELLGEIEGHVCRVVG